MEQYYLPALRDCRGILCEMLIDPDRPRIDELAGRYRIPKTGTSLEDLPSTVEGVVVAAPNDLHQTIVTDALRGGAHVLCEKPLGRNTDEVSAMVHTADDTGRRLFAAMICRRYPAIRDTAGHGLPALLGDLYDIDASYGFPLDWPVKSPAYYDKQRAGGGALLDFGAHLVDALLHVLGHPPYEVVSYADDADAGVDAEAEGRIALFLSGGRVECTVRASRLRRLRNAIVLRGANGTLEIPMSALHPATLRLGSGSWPVTAYFGSALPCFADQLEDFGRAIRDEPHNLPDGSSQKDSIALIEGMYACRTRLTFAWDS